jgi:hypothetical protein
MALTTLRFVKLATFDDIKLIDIGIFMAYAIPRDSPTSLAAFSSGSIFQTIAIPTTDTAVQHTSMAIRVERTSVATVDVMIRVIISTPPLGICRRRD